MFIVDLIFCNAFCTDKFLTWFIKQEAALLSMFLAINVSEINSFVVGVMTSNVFNFQYLMLLAFLNLEWVCSLHFTHIASWQSMHLNRIFVSTSQTLQTIWTCPLTIDCENAILNDFSWSLTSLVTRYVHRCNSYLIRWSNFCLNTQMISKCKQKASQSQLLDVLYIIYKRRNNATEITLASQYY